MNLEVRSWFAIEIIFLGYFSEKGHSWMMQSQQNAVQECTGVYSPTKWIPYRTPFSYFETLLATAGEEGIYETQCCLCDKKKRSYWTAFTKSFELCFI